MQYFYPITDSKESEIGLNQEKNAFNTIGEDSYVSKVGSSTIISLIWNRNFRVFRASPNLFFRTKSTFSTKILRW